VERLTLSEQDVVVGRVDPETHAAPTVDLTPFDPQQSVSRGHSRISLDNGTALLEDLESRNKTRLGDAALPPGDPEPLRGGDLISFGSVQAVFRLLGKTELPEGFAAS